MKTTPNPYLFLRLQFDRRYWILKNQLRRISFWFGKLGFRVRSERRQQHEFALVLKEFVRAARLATVVAASLAVAVLLLDRLPYFRKFSLAAASLTELLSAVAQISGVFLGLYFATVSVVATTAYARVPSDVRYLLIREKVGSSYLRLVAVLAALCTLLIVGQALGLRLGVASLGVVGALAVLTILGFVPVGLRAFRFLDPTELADLLSIDFLVWAREATPGGHRWDDPSFQNHYQQQAGSVLNTMGRVVGVADSESHLRGVTLVQLGFKIAILYSSYVQLKPRLPTQSLWFRRTARFKDWLDASDSEVSIALQTGTSLHPTDVPDHLWVETELAEILKKIIVRLLDSHDLRNAAALAGQLVEVLYVLGRRGDLDEGLLIQTSLLHAIRSAGTAQPIAAAPTLANPEELRQALALTDASALIVLALVLSISERASGISSDSITRRVDKIDWSRRRTLYGPPTPRQVLVELEFLQRGLEFETDVEGSIITPPWYRYQKTAAGFASWISDSIEKLLRTIEDVFDSEVRRLREARQILQAAQLVERGLETCSKMETHLSRFRSGFEAAGQLRSLTDLSWSETDWERSSERIEHVRSKLLLNLAELLPELEKVRWSADRPDYLGHAYVLLAQECYSAMAADDEALFERVFPSYFQAALRAVDRLRAEAAAAGARAQLVRTTDIVHDLLEISGYALLFSDLGGKSFGAVVQRVWDAYFASLPDPVAAAKFIAALTAFRQGVFAVTPRMVTRTSWKQDFERRTRRRGPIPEPSELAEETDLEASLPATPLIRAFLRSPHTLYFDARDVFIVAYLSRRPDTANIELTKQASSFRRSLEKEEAADSGPTSK